MSWFQALILGLIQGLTEYLPVSSSGHLAIGGALFGLNGEENLTFTIAVHAATVLSTILVLWKEIAALLQGLFQFRWNEETIYLSKILLSMIPVGIVGVFFKDYVEVLFGSGLLLIGCMLILTAALLLFSYYVKPRKKSSISFRDAFIIGIAQAVAVLPGLSRSGTTISTGLFLGNRKSKIAQFSFLMVIIPVLGESFLDLIKGDFSTAQSGISPFSLLVGFIAAFISGTIACKWMLNLVKKGKLIYFAYYCIIAGTAVIAYTLFE
ncbi:MAG: undecaprenyl-diphosphate phosphatase [Candidatus Symbiothrix sp.]|nr:undecaprenyl-diphosphate phosphatase [Candidatus Symbiothrix sp.]